MQYKTKLAKAEDTDSLLDKLKDKPDIIHLLAQRLVGPSHQPIDDQKPDEEEYIPA
jgi:hypothetical protein